METNVLLSIGFLAILFAVASAQTDPYCYADIAAPNLYFGPKTSYKFIKNTNTDQITLPGKQSI